MSRRQETSPAKESARAERIATQTRHEGWRKPPRRIEPSECIGCDACIRSCPPEFGAIFDRGIDVFIVPELCSGCPFCIMACPVDCIYVDEDWQPTDSDMWNHVALDS